MEPWLRDKIRKCRQRVEHDKKQCTIVNVGYFSTIDWIPNQPTKGGG